MSTLSNTPLPHVGGSGLSEYMLVSPMQSLNAHKPIEVTLSGMLTLVSPEQYANLQAFVFHVVTLSMVEKCLRFSGKPEIKVKI